MPVLREERVFEKNVGDLLNFLEKTKGEYPDPITKLGKWVNRQRIQKNKGKMARSREEKFDQIGFVWDFQKRKRGKITESWEKNYTALEKYLKRNQGRYPNKDTQLGGWTNQQRTKNKKGNLSKEKVDELNKIGFSWNYQKEKASETWMNHFQDLQEYAIQTGNPNMTRAHPNRILANWVWIQRQRKRGTYRSNKEPMQPNEIQLLEGIGFIWKKNEYFWEDNFQKYKTAKQKAEIEKEPLNTHLPNRLLSWVAAQRRNFKAKTLSQERIQRLQNIKFEWIGKITGRPKKKRT